MQTRFEWGTEQVPKFIQPIELRDYQQEMLTSVFDDWGRGLDNLIAVLPTGAGKTTAAGAVIDRWLNGRGGERVLVLAHTRKLVRQFSHALKREWNIESGIEMGGEQAWDQDVVCASRQTMTSRLDTYSESEFDLIVVDEAHRCLSEQYQKIIGHFGKAKVLGITATPRRGDQRDLMAFFEKVSIDVPFAQLVDEGHLARIRVVNFPVEIDVTKVETVRGDYDDNQLSHAIEPYFDAVAQELSNWRGRKMLAFLPLVETSKSFAEACRRAGLRSLHVDGTTDEREQDAAISRLRSGELDIVTNAILLSEGVDIPEVDLILNLRLTKSWTLYMQIMGRGTRRPEGKSDCILLDPLWLCEEHSMVMRPSCLVAANDVERDEMDRAVSQGGQGGGIDLLEAHESAKNTRAAALRARLDAGRKKGRRSIDPMLFFSDSGLPMAADWEPVSRWESDPVSDGQKETLKKHGFDLSKVPNKGYASLLIDTVFKRLKEGAPSPRQAAYALELGMDSPHEKSRKEVSDYISKHAPYAYQQKFKQR